MPSLEHERLERLFGSALALDSSAERTEFLNEACGDDSELRASVERLLEAHTQADTFLDVPVIDPDATIESLSVKKSQITGRIGPYRILQELGEGGFGSVYLAEQETPVRRKVALKLIKLGMDTRQVIARFEAERQALALMDHANIARVLDAGATDAGRPYFVMELVRGEPITQYCDKHKLTVRQRLELLLPVCLAVQHAHQKGVIHRDIKPGNVLVTLHDSRPTPKVIDFGIAKATGQRLTDKTLFTEFRQFIGTPEYMSPDQIEVSGLDVDTRTDIYSLGVLMYVLLAGVTPFEAKTFRSADLVEIRRILREVDPPKPSMRIQTRIAEGEPNTRLGPDSSALPRLVRGDLDWIVMKALEKDRTRRYQTASELASDIQRHLNDEPVLAGPPSYRYRFSKAIRRHRAVVLAGLVVGAAVLGGLLLSIAGYVQATRAKEALSVERDAAEIARAAEVKQRKSAEAHAARAQLASSFLREMLASVDPRLARGREVTVRYILDEAARRIASGLLAEQPEVEARTLMTLGETYAALGLYAAAEAQLRAAIETLGAVRGEDNSEVLRFRSALVGVLHSQLRHAEAEKLARAVLAAQLRVLGGESLDALTTQSHLAVALTAQGKLSEAEAIHHRTLNVQRRLLGDEHVQTLRSLVNLGAVYHAQGRITEAEQLLQQAVSSGGRVLGAAHPDVTNAMNELARVLESQGKTPEAEVLYRKCWELDRRILGSDHPRTQIPMNNLLRVLRAQGKSDETRPLVQARLARLHRAAANPEASALALHAYAWELLTCEPADLRDPIAAASAAQRAVDRDGGGDANLLETLARAHRQNQDLDRAIEIQRQAVALARAGGTYDRVEMNDKLIEMLMENGDFVGAASLRLGGVAAQLGRSVSSDYESVGGSLIREAVELTARGDFAEAEQVFSACFGIRQKSLPADHWALAETRSFIGASVAAQLRFAEAEPILLDAHKALAGNPRAPRRVVNVSRGHLADMYDLWGRPQSAHVWRKEPSVTGSGTDSSVP